MLAAVPKSMTVAMEPQLGGRTLQPAAANAITQRLTCVNGLCGTKPLAVRLKVTYTVGGVAKEHLGVVSGLPPGL